jgi:hypothetical protein
MGIEMLKSDLNTLYSLTEAMAVSLTQIHDSAESVSDFGFLIFQITYRVSTK